MTDSGNNDGKLPTAVKKAIEEATKGLPQEKRQAVIQVIQQVSKTHHGPLPDPETLDAYNVTLPGSAERLLSLLETESQHRRTQEATFVKTHRHKTLAGQWIAASLAALFGWWAYQLGIAGHDWLAGVFSTSTIGGIITVFVLGRRTNESDNENHASETSRK